MSASHIARTPATTRSKLPGTRAMRANVSGTTASMLTVTRFRPASRNGRAIPHICYHSPLMGPIQTCDTCIVEVDGQLVRTCGTKVGAHMKVVTE